MKNLIRSQLHEISQEEGVHLLWAGESGSRAWGFASPHSDYDVRFIYVYPQERYLQLEPVPETISRPIQDSLDFSGWELRKALRLVAKSNATPMEWMQSPVVYLEKPSFREDLFGLVKDYIRPRALIYHYLGVIKSAIKSGIEGDTINIKKYFYILRPLLAAAWAAKHRTVAPMNFDALLPMVDSYSLKEKILLLRKTKEQAREGDRQRFDPEIMQYIAHEMNRLEALAETLPKTDGVKGFGPLNNFFLSWINLQTQ
ncbi:MAG TPA: hypothetical protein DCE41_27080 [Cytophagales bacterium]|nr:hypothetical protein [Cytophagales bacterium]HAA22637.1 hypothetical protein [Cytophagales bacterium]HAP61116.1 hypothetical protein [Cytophagales bacterium]